MMRGNSKARRLKRSNIKHNANRRLLNGEVISLIYGDVQMFVTHPDSLRTTIARLYRENPHYEKLKIDFNGFHYEARRQEDKWLVALHSLDTPYRIIINLIENSVEEIPM